MDGLVSSRPLLTARLRRRLLRHHLPLGLLTLLAITALVFVAPSRDGSWIRDGLAGGSSGAGAMRHGPGRTGSETGPADPTVGGAGHQANARFDHGNGMAGTPVPASGLARPLTTATGYFGLVLLAATLLVGPTSRLTQRATPLSLDIRRDLGIWTAIVSMLHVVLGFQIHGDGRVLGYFLDAETLALRRDAFGLANYTGLAATGIVLMLVAISNDAALRRLKAGPWKRLQRLSIVAFALVVAHSVLYGALGSRATLYSVLLVASVAVVILLRIGGAWAGRSPLARVSARSGPTRRRGGVSPSEYPTT
jgi:methionine sulfoxide reductase heme-binding subunit